MKEVFIDVPNSVPDPYFGYIQERNGNFAQCIAGMLGASYVGGFDQVGVASGERYCVPAIALTQEVGRKFGVGIGELLNFYGVLLGKEEHASKAMLHELINDTSIFPDYYSPLFAEFVRDSVLRGFTAFSRGDIFEADRLLKERGLARRLKFTNQSDGDGQFRIRNGEQFKFLLSNIFDKDIFQDGIVVEEHLF